MNADQSSMVSRKDAKIAKKNAKLGPKMNENEIGRIIVDAAVVLHRELGPGLLESVYEAVLARELADRGLKVERQVSIPIVWRGMRFDEGFRADIIAEDKVIVELKSVESVNNAHKKQLLTYLRLADMKLGFLLNFGAAVMKDGITRTVNGLAEDQ
jgi:GxxExxY protein